jgi:hypothetical protein
MAATGRGTAASHSNLTAFTFKKGERRSPQALFDMFFFNQPKKLKSFHE